MILGIDVGSSSVKCCVFNPDDGSIVATGSTSYPTHHPRPMAAEQLPDDWWRAITATVRSVLRGVPRNAVQAIGVSAHAPAILEPCDAQGSRRVHIWMDRQSDAVATALEISSGELLTSITWNRVDPYFGVPKMIWLAEQGRLGRRPITGVTGYLVWRLCGALGIDRSSAGLVGAYDVVSGTWSSAVMAAAGLPCELLPPIVEATDVLGKLSKEVAEEWGLSTNVRVTGGTTDAAAAVVGANIPLNQLFEMSGQSSGVGIVLDAPVNAPDLVLFPHAVPGQWLIKGSLQASGASLSWWAREFYDGATPPESLETEARESPPGANGVAFLPHLMGERAPFWNSHASGVFLGLGLGSTRADMLRAVMEGVAYGIGQVLDAFTAAGYGGSTMIGVGGGYRNQLWNQIKADVTGRRIVLADLTGFASAVGAAKLAAVGTGDYSRADISPDRTAMRSAPVVTPDSRVGALYAGRALAMRCAYDQLLPAFSAFHQVADRDPAAIHMTPKEQHFDDGSCFSHTR
jgi:xylulokinase